MRIILFLFLLGGFTNLIAQNTVDTIEQNLPKNQQSVEDKCLFQIGIYGIDGQKKKNIQVFLKQKPSGRIYKAKTQNNGNALFLIPLDKEFDLFIGNNKVIKKIKTPKYAFSFYKTTFILKFKAIKNSNLEPLMDSVFIDILKKPIQRAGIGDADITIILLNRINKPVLMTVPVRLLDAESKIVYISNSDESNGEARFFVPRNKFLKIGICFDDYVGQLTIPKHGYMIRKNINFNPSCLSQKKQDKITKKISEKPKQKVPEVTYGYINITINSNEGMPIPGENVYLNVEGSDKIYTSFTNRDGEASFKVPDGKRYRLHLKYEKNIDVFDFSDRKDTTTVKVSKSYNYIGSKILESPGNKDVKRSYFRKKFKEYVSGKFNFNDSTVLKVMNRNPQWKNKLIVTDLTASMYPYSGQLLVWYKLNYLDQDILELVFFNDGDGKPIERKRIGNTGGIYFCEDCNYENLFNVMIETIVAGNGGENPENDMEAMIKAIKETEKFDNLILIADNYSQVRDMELLEKLNVPVKIILCGVTSFVSLEYLNIAYKTKGTVHTIENDIVNIASTLEGETITIKNKKYRLSRGTFVYQPD